MRASFTSRTIRFLFGLVLLGLVAACNNPVTSTTLYSSGPQVSGLPMGGGLTVYVGMVNKDSYRTGLMVYPNGGSQWNQLLSTAATVNDINVDSSGNIAVAEPSSVWYYTKSTGVWSSASATGTVNQVSLGGTTTLYLATSSGLYSWAVPGFTSPTTVATPNSLSVKATGLGTGYFGTSSGLFSIATAAKVGGASNAVYTSTINGVYASGSNVYAATAVGFSLSTDSGTSWTDTLSSAIGLGTPLCVYYYNGIVYLGTANGVATYNGTTWSTSNLATPVYSIAAATANGNTSIYAATPAGLYIYSSGSSVVQSGWSVVFSGYGVNKVVVTVP